MAGGDTVCREIFEPVLFSPLLPSLSAGKLKTELIQISYIISLLIQLCLRQFKKGRNHLQVMTGKITECENVCVYSNSRSNQSFSTRVRLTEEWVITIGAA